MANIETSRRKGVGRIELGAYVKQYHSEDSQKRIKKEAEKLAIENILSLVRNELEVTQKELSLSLGISQPTLSGFEKMGEDMKISTMRRYVEGLDCGLKISISLPTGNVISVDL